MEIYDISQTVREGIPVWPGDQRYRLRWKMRLSKGDLCNVSTVTMSCHTGTHVDAPFHFDDSGPGIGAVPLTRYVGPARVVALQSERAVTASELGKLDWTGVERVLFRTRAAGKPEDRFDRSFVHLQPDGAEFLAKLKLALVGTDAPSIDAFDSRLLESHRILADHGVAILEGVRLDHVPPGDYELICLPLKLEGLDGSPVRAILRKYE